MLSHSQACRAVRRQERGILPRLRSIREDAAFVEAVRQTYTGFACFGNQRCGTWYVGSCAGAEACYFKSTDGHAGHWQFSATRLNLFVAELAAAAGGAIVVDSTRRGKPFPDALTKTVPAWCAVVNHIVLGEALEAASFPRWLPPSEVAVIRSLLPVWVASLSAAVVSAMRSALAGRLTVPLRPHWVCNAIDADAPCTSLDVWEACVLPLLDGSDGEGGGAASVPVLCVSASRLVSERGDAPSAQAGWGYVQVSGGRGVGD